MDSIFNNGIYDGRSFLPLTSGERLRLAQRLKQGRTEAGLTQQQVCARVEGMTQAVLSKLEAGLRGVDVLELKALARLYGKPVSWFVEEAGGSDSSLPYLSEGEEDIVKTITLLDAHARKLLFRQFEALINVMRLQ